MDLANYVVAWFFYMLHATVFWNLGFKKEGNMVANLLHVDIILNYIYLSGLFTSTCDLLLHIVFVVFASKFSIALLKMGRMGNLYS